MIKKFFGTKIRCAMTVAGAAVLLYLLWFGFCAFCYYYIGPYQMMPVDLSQPVEIESDPFDLNILKVRGILFVDNMTDNSHMFKLSPARCKAAEMVDYFWEQSPNPLSVSGWDLYQNSVDRYLKSPFSLEENGDLYNETTDTLIAENVRGYIYKDGKLYYDRVEENQFVFYHDKKQIAAMPAWGEVFAYEVVDHFLVVACEKPLNNSIRIWNLEKNQMEFEHKNAEKFMCRNTEIWFRTKQGVGMYDLQSGTAKDIQTPPYYGMASFDQTYVYFLQENDDVVRLNTDTWQTELVAKSRLNNPMIRYFLKFIPTI